MDGSNESKDRSLKDYNLTCTCVHMHIHVRVCMYSVFTFRIFSYFPRAAKDNGN